MSLYKIKIKTADTRCVYFWTFSSASEAFSAALEKAGTPFAVISVRAV